ncbi:MAG: Na+/H+ antiporter subunit E [Clostridia bacterium]
MIWIGLLVCGLIYAFSCKFFGYSIKSELRMLKKSHLLIQYFALLIKEIFVANIIVMKMIIFGKEVEPVLCTFKTDLKSTNARVLLSHSITLTPGTITVELKDNEYKIHCLDKSLAEGLDNSGFIKLLKKIEN